MVAHRNRASEPRRVLKWFSTSGLQTSAAHLWAFHSTPMCHGKPVENGCNTLSWDPVGLIGNSDPKHAYDLRFTYQLYAGSRLEELVVHHVACYQWHRKQSVLHCQLGAAEPPVEQGWLRRGLNCIRARSGPGHGRKNSRGKDVAVDLDPDLLPRVSLDLG